MYEYKVIIDRWVDGDTVDVDIDLGFDVVLKKQRVRLHGIDAWESRTRDLEEKEKGLPRSSVRTSVRKVNPQFLKQRLMMQVVSMVESLERFGLLVSLVISHLMNTLLRRVTQKNILVVRDNFERLGST